MRNSSMSFVLILAVVALTTTIEAKPEVAFSPAVGAINVIVDGKPLTSYIHTIDPDKPMAAESVLLTKPVLYPLRTPAGIIVTRGWPFEKIEGERQDHPHHIGLYFTYDQINGNNFWNNSKNALPAIKHLNAEVTTDAQGNSALKTIAHWIGTDNKPLLEEKRMTSFIPGADQHVIDIDIQLKAISEEVSFGDTKEGMFAIRLAQWLTENTDRKYQLGTGTYLNCHGDEKEKDVWGKRAEWVRIQGQKDNKTVGIAILNHPTSTNFPTYWHARGYGAFSANPLGQYAFQRSRKVPDPKPFNLTLKKGQSAPFKFRVIIYDGLKTKKRLDAEFKKYAK
jgi:hypothetical protein